MTLIRPSFPSATKQLYAYKSCKVGVHYYYVTIGPCTIVTDRKQYHPKAPVWTWTCGESCSHWIKYKTGSIMDAPHLYTYINPLTELEPVGWLEVLLATGFSKRALKKVINGQDRAIYDKEEGSS